MSADPALRREIPDATVARLPEYLRTLSRLAEDGVLSVSSEELAAEVGVRSAQLRKDLSHLGSYGVRGVGYDVETLALEISRALGLTEDWPVAIVGMGNLGHALASYSGFVTKGFRIVGLYDDDPALADERIVGVPIRPLAELSPTTPWTRSPSASSRRRRPPPRPCATPSSAPASARSSTSRPAVLSVPNGVDVRRVDLSTELQILAFHAQRKSLAAGDLRSAVVAQ